MEWDEDEWTEEDKEPECLGNYILGDETQEKQTTQDLPKGRLTISGASRNH